MFKKLKDKIAEEVKISPQRIQQLTQSVTDRLQSPASEDNFFSLGDDDSVASNATIDAGFSEVNLHSSTPDERTRRYSNSSMASDVSFLPRYEPTGNLYHMQSDLDISASEVEDNASTSSQLGHVSKEQVYSAFQKAQMRYHKYRGRYTDLAKHYKILEKDVAKIKRILVETQDKAIRRVNELKEQCFLEQKAKAHLENALRVELDEKQIKIDTLQTKIQLLSNESCEDQTMDNSDTLKDIETLNAKIQELKANVIVFNTKETEYKQKINQQEKSLQEQHETIAGLTQRERDLNLKSAQNKMELHTEIQNKDLEITNMKREIETLKQDLNKYEKSRGNGRDTKMENLQSQNLKLIEKIDVLNHKCKNYESELIKLEQYKIEITNLNEIVAKLRKSNEEIKTNDELNRNLMKKNEELQLMNDEMQKKLEEINVDDLVQENVKLQEEIVLQRNLNAKQIEEMQTQLKSEYEENLSKMRNNMKSSLLTLETKIKGELTEEFKRNEELLKLDFKTKLEKLTTNENKTNEIKVMECEDKIKSLETLVGDLQMELANRKQKYTVLENNHLELINENNKLRVDVSNFVKESEKRAAEIDNLQREIIKFKQLFIKHKEEMKKLEDEISKLKENSFKENTTDEISSLKQEIFYKTNEMEALEKEFVSMREKLNEELLSQAQNCQTLQDEISLLQEVSTEQQNLNCSLTIQIKNFEEEKEKLKNQLVDLFTQKQTNEDLSLRNNFLEKEIETLNKTNANMLEQIEQISTKYTEMETQRFQKDETNAKLLKTIEDLELKNTLCDEESSKLLQNYTKLNQNYDTLKLQSKEIEIKTNEAIQERDNLILSLRDQQNSIKQELELKTGEKAKLEELNTRLETDLNNRLHTFSEYEVKYKTVMDENDNLKRSKLEFENLHLTKLENLEKQQNEEIKQLRQDLLNLKVCNENLKGVEEQNLKLREEIAELQTRITEILNENQSLKENVAKLKQFELNCSEALCEKEQILHKYEQVDQEMAEIERRNRQLSSDYKQILSEHENILRELAEHKVQYEAVQKHIDMSESYGKENEQLKDKITQLENELQRLEQEKHNLEKLQNSTVQSNETQSSSLKNRINELENISLQHEASTNENIQLKIQLSNLTQKYDKLNKEKFNTTSQLAELECHYNEVVHEKQLLQDEIQELKISPLNLNEDNLLNSKEIESLREKLEQYKSIDKSNRTSIEFYENELQKLKSKNEKLCRKLDETLVTLPVLAGNNDDSTAVLEYLRNVLFNYMTGKESLILAKVIAAVCKFDKDQTDLVLQKEQQRQTILGQLFGS